MAVDPDRVVESLDVFENEPVGLRTVPDPEPIQPLSLNQGMEGFDTCVIVRISLPAIAQLELLSCLPISLRNKLRTAVRMKNKGLVGLTP